MVFVSDASVSAVKQRIEIVRAMKRARFHNQMNVQIAIVIIIVRAIRAHQFNVFEVELYVVVFKIFAEIIDNLQYLFLDFRL